VTDNGKSIFHFMNKSGKAASEAFDAIVAETPDAGSETKGRGLTTKQGVESMTFSQIMSASREDLAAIIGGMQQSFLGLSFDEDHAMYQGQTQPLAGTTAVVDSAGHLSRRPTLSRVAVGGVLFGALGAIGGGLLQKKEDTRQVFILIDGIEAAWAVPAKPDQFGEATQFAARFNSAAKNAAAAAPDDARPADSAPDGIAAQLASLADPHATGALSDEEYSQAKSAVLGGG
jgi:hypothetical protein